MYRILKTTEAEQDLINIWLYSYKNWGDRQAGKYLDGLEEGFKLLAVTPLLCRLRHEFIQPVRIHHHAHHLIIYDVLPGRINIVRVLHESMDIETQLEEGSAG
ncbi:MAG: type II toxin-antitoxin system RelE/ParE family toxin [Gammaproteobacteria bacterium]